MDVERKLLSRFNRGNGHQNGLAVIGTVGLLEQAAERGLLKLPEAMDRLRQTNARLDPELIQAALERDKARKQARPNGSD